MASFVLETLFAITGMNPTANATAPVMPSNSTGPVTSQALPAALPTDLSSLVSLLFSFSALRDWLKLIVIGGFFETCRRWAFYFYYKIIDSFYITAYFQEDDTSYDWVMVWLSKQPAWSAARTVQISTRSFGLNDQTSVLIPGEEEDASSSLSGTRRLAYLPSVSTSYSFWYKRRWVSVTRTQDNTGYYGRREETLMISIMARSHRVLNDLLLEAKRQYLAAQEHTISIYISDTANNWRHVASRPKRPLRSIVLDPGVKDLLIDDARDFLESKSWYADRGIPFRRGYLLYGAPGSGKTSMIHSMAGELGLDVYVVSLSRLGLDDTSLNALISELPEKCIALMEDIDAAFHHGLNRDTQSEGETPSSDGSSQQQQQNNNNNNGRGAPPPSTSRLSLSGLLNALDGVGAQEGRILYATTNKYTSLDPALCRPGRMDIHVEFKLASKYQSRELFRCFYLPAKDVTDTPETEDNDDEGSEKDSLDSGYGSTDHDLIDLDVKVDAGKAASDTPTALVHNTPVFVGRTHAARAPKLSRRHIDVLANRFSDSIPDREFSMAALQGYLMAYKTRPIEAAQDATAWVEKERAEALQKQKKKTPLPVAKAAVAEAVAESISSPAESSPS